MTYSKPPEKIIPLERRQNKPRKPAKMDKTTRLELPFILTELASKTATNNVKRPAIQLEMVAPSQTNKEPNGKPKTSADLAVRSAPR